MIREAPAVYYPSSFYAGMFAAMGKRTFPGPRHYEFAQDKVRQSALFGLLGVPHPRTRVYYGRQQARIAEDFPFPFVAKEPRGSARGMGVFLVRNKRELAVYLEGRHVAYIQEYVPSRRDVRVVVIGGRCRLAYWRCAPEGGFHANVAQGGRIDFSGVPEAAVALAEDAARRSGFDDCGMDVIFRDGAPLVLEANMKYGKEGFRQAGMDFTKLMEKLLADGQI